MKGLTSAVRAGIILSIALCVSPAAAVNPSLSGSLTLHFFQHPDDPETPEVNESFWYFDHYTGGIGLSVPSPLEITTVGAGNFNWNNPASWSTFPLDMGGLSISHTGSGTWTAVINNGQGNLNVLQGSGPTEYTVQTRVDFPTVTNGEGFTVLSNVANTRYNVTLPTGAHMNDNQIPKLQNLTLNSGASINQGGFTRTIRQNLTNHGSGEFNDNIGGNFINDALSGSGNVANALFMIIDGQLQNTGELHIPGQLRTNSATGNSGTIKLNGGDFNPQAAFANNGTFLFSAGGLNGPGVVTNNGTFDWSGNGNMNGIVVNATSSFTISGSTFRTLVGTLTNQGTITESGGHTLSFSSTGILNNQAGALYDILDDSTMYAGFGGLGTINNAGTFRKSGGSGVTTLAPAFNNTGTITVSSGTLRFLGGGTLGGTMSVSNGGVIRLGHGNFDAQGLLAVSGDGTLEMAADGNTNVIVANGNSASFANFTGGADLVLSGGHLRVDAGGALTLNLTGTSSVQLIGPSVTKIGGAGTTTNLGNFAWTQGFVVGNLRNESANFTISGPNTHYIEGGNLTNAGTITHSDGGALQIFQGTFVNVAGALYDITGDGDITASLATDTVTNAGTFRKSGGSGTSVITTPLTNAGTLAIESGTMLFAGPNVLTLAESGTLAFKLSGINAGTDYGTVSPPELVANGTLAVSLESGFQPSLGNTFDILDWQTISGGFDALTLPALSAGLAWNANQLYTTGVLSVIVDIPGDYNHNGIVDAPDYVLYRNTLGQSGAALAADGNHNGSIDSGDYGVWRSHFGQTTPGAGSGSALGTTGSDSAVVPEPSTALSAIVSIAAAVLLSGAGRSTRIRKQGLKLSSWPLANGLSI